jgi:hypothetical protein
MITMKLFAVAPSSAPRKVRSSSGPGSSIRRAIQSGVLVLSCSCAGLIAQSAAPVLAASAQESDLGDSPATVLDIGLHGLGDRLFQIGMAQHESFGSRSVLETRFVPNLVQAFRTQEPEAGRDIIIMVSYRHGEPDLGDAGAEARCKAMIHWVRFNLGVKDGGALIAYASDHPSSTLYKYIPLPRPLAEEEERTWAQSLDRRTLVTATVSPMGSDGDGRAFCRAPLVVTPEARIDF